MKNETKIADATNSSDISGLKLDNQETYSQSDIYFYEAQNILKAYAQYLSDTPSKKLAPFDYESFLKVHKDMFGDVWDWAGKI